MDLSRLSFRTASERDLTTLVRLLADDPLGSSREVVSDPVQPEYAEAFRIIDSDPHQEVLVATLDGEVVGMLQITYVPSLTYRGSWRGQIEGVRVSARVRSLGVGRRLVEEAVDRARTRGCRMVQLTTDKERPRAIRFYEGMGFTATHEGMKLHLTRTPDG